jgi:shikimate kinase/3-dehydroquinate synthase
MAPVGNGEGQGSPQRSIVFIGFMGAGKSKAAKAAGASLGVEVVDADAVLEAQLGMPIAAFFEREGEAEFRRREAEVVGAMLEHGAGQVIALGGGSVLSEQVRDALAGHVVVWLDASTDAIWDRIDRDKRPLARDRGEFDRLHAERAPIYAGLADAIVPGFRDVVPDALPSIAALRDAPDGTRLLWATSASASYPVFVGRRIIGAHLAPGEGRSYCVTDSTVGPLYAAELGAFAEVAIEPGEASKTLATAEQVWGSMVEAGLTRHDRVLALGGGVVGDLAGFCAATYQRGLQLVHIPTTLVAQIDSSIGGKTGVDLAHAKNYVGAYHMPQGVVADTETLSTLPEAELAAGFVEVLKTGLLAGGALWDRVRGIEALDPADLDDVVFDCIRYKLGVVAEDARDAGLRMVLNLGHTVGHAIEAASGYGRYRHGEAVGLGLLASLRLSEADDLRAETEAALERFGLPTSLDPEIGTAAILDALERDKKRTERGVGFILLREPGEPLVGQLVDRASVEAAVEDLR